MNSHLTQQHRTYHRQKLTKKEQTQKRRDWTRKSGSRILQNPKNHLNFLQQNLGKNKLHSINPMEKTSNECNDGLTTWTASKPAVDRRDNVYRRPRPCIPNMHRVRSPLSRSTLRIQRRSSFLCRHQLLRRQYAQCPPPRTGSG